MTKLSSLVLNSLLLMLLFAVLVLPAVSMGVANVLPSHAVVLSEQAQQPVEEVVKQATQSTPSQRAR